MRHTWHPKHDQIIVQPLAEADRTKGGLVLPETSRERPQEGVVLAVGGELRRTLFRWLLGWCWPLPETRIGDLVVFGRYAGSTFDLDGQDVLIMRDLETLARKSKRDYELTHHEGDPKLSHLADRICDHCPTSELDAERARFQEELKAEVARGGLTGDGELRETAGW